jgi:peroxiredoxin
MYPELVNNGLQVLAINVGEPAYKVANFVTSYQLNYKVLLDKDTNVTYSFDVLGVPTYVLVGEKGKITFISHTFPKDKYKDLIQR